MYNRTFLLRQIPVVWDSGENKNLIICTMRFYVFFYNNFLFVWREFFYGNFLFS